MAEERFLGALPALNGKVAIVTGYISLPLSHTSDPNSCHRPFSDRRSSGGAGLGLATTIYLARLGCKVYVASRNQQKCTTAIASAQSALKAQGVEAEILFHQLDLASIRDAKASASEFLKREQRLDILIANAGVSLLPLDELSVDGWERIFATNHLGHFAFVTGLLGTSFCSVTIVVVWYY